MERGSQIRNFTICRYVERVVLHEHALIGRGNWIIGWPSDDKSSFGASPDRRSQLIIGRHAAITPRHRIDCTAEFSLGEFSTLAGSRSHVLTHSIDLAKSRQTAIPVRVGRYCFIGSDCVLLPGSSLPDYSVLGAKALLADAQVTTHQLYVGVPARPVRELDEDLLYFHRTEGFIR